MKKILAFISFCIISNVMRAEIASGTCGADGDNITWSLSDDGVLTISGEGKMGDYSSATIPWSDFREKIKKVSFEGKIENICDHAFSGGCSNLTSVIISSNVTCIGDGAFNACNSLTSITIPSSVTSIGDGAFRNCSSLTSVTIPSGVTRIGSWAFWGCSSLTSVTIPSTVTSIGSWAFWCCGFTSITIPFGVISIDNGAFANCSHLTSITIPSSVTSIGDDAFNSCLSLTSAIISSNVTCIGSNAFWGCSSLTSITIPSSVTSIGDGAFSGCELRTIIARQTDPSGYETAYTDQTYRHATLYVPEGTYWAYVYDSDWGEFINIKEVVNNASEVKANNCYMIADEKGCNYAVWDDDAKELKNVDYTHNLDEEAEGTYWQVNASGKRCTIYNVGANRYGAIDGNGKISLSTTPVEMGIEDKDGSITLNGKPMLLVVSRNSNVTAVKDVMTKTANGYDGMFFDNGRVVIRKNGRTYDAAGSLMK